MNHTQGGFKGIVESTKQAYNQNHSTEAEWQDQAAQHFRQWQLRMRHLMLTTSLNQREGVDRTAYVSKIREANKWLNHIRKSKGAEPTIIQLELQHAKLCFVLT